jgi:hypothetical protein
MVSNRASGFRSNQERQKARTSAFPSMRFPSDGRRGALENRIIGQTFSQRADVVAIQASLKESIALWVV